MIKLINWYMYLYILYRLNYQICKLELVFIEDLRLYQFKVFAGKSIQIYMEISWLLMPWALHHQNISTHDISCVE